MKIGFWEIVAIIVVALLVIGPDKLPEYMKAFGKGLNSLKSATAEFSNTVQENVVQPLDQASGPLKEALQPIQDTANDMNHEMNDLKKSVNDVGKGTVKKETNSWVCPKCGTLNHDAFCSHCGTKKQDIQEGVKA